MLQPLDVVILTNSKQIDNSELINQLAAQRVHLIEQKEISGATLGSTLMAGESDWVLLINAAQYKIVLKQSCFDLLRMVGENKRDWSMIYSDYEILTEGSIREEHLLDHHAGRLRDDTDYGFVWLIAKKQLESALPLSSGTKQNFLYDLRLRLSEQGRIGHIANRYAGSLYTVQKQADTQNVFSYLMAGKESQLELERLASEHLQRIGAYLEPGEYYETVPYYGKSYDLAASVVIPVNNRPQFIGPAIESVLNQTLPEVEVIVVVNGGGQDPTIPAVKAYQRGGAKYDAAKPVVKLIVHDINNIGFCINSGLEVAKGKFYVQLDSDDQLIPDAVEKIIATYAEDPKIGMVIGSYEVWELESSGELTRMGGIPVVTHGEWTEANGRNNLLRINGAGAPRSFYIDLAKDMGLLDMNTSPYARNYGEDYHFVLRLSEHYRIGRIRDPIYKVVRHAGGTDHSIDHDTIDRNNNAKDWMRLEALNRRKAMNGVS